MSSPRTETDEIDEASDAGNQLMLQGAPFGLEKIYDYEAGGHHPVHLGDLLGPTSRYRVMNKLGSGGFGTVWMCRDLSSNEPIYVALKILMADYSKDDCPELRVRTLKESISESSPGKTHICLPLDDFRIDGPNGSHLCFVYPVLGPRAFRILKDFENPDVSLRRIALQSTEALVALHEHGICHGDLTPSNILLRTEGLNGLPESDVIEALGEPRRVAVTTVDGNESLDSSAPKYLVHPVDLNHVGTQFVTDQACIIDFGESFETADPPEELGTPTSYRSPELVLGQKAGQASDIWALACSIFEIRTGRKLFSTFDDDSDEYLDVVVLLLGKLPEPWWSTWEGRKITFKEEPDDQGKVVKIRKSDDAVPTHTSNGIAIEPRSIREAVAPGLYYDGIQLGMEVHRSISEDEVELLADLLNKMLHLDPEQRLSARDAMAHDWFKLQI